MNLSVLIYASLGGILPALVWLLFWLREDRKNPEPNRLILKTFLFGMISVLLVIPLQREVEHFFPTLILVQVLLWAFLEEGLKFLSGYFGGLHNIEDNEPVDPIIYMITAALGFVALENTLFLLSPLMGNSVTDGLITGNLRFIGAGLLHVVSSGIIGVSLALGFYRSRFHWFIRSLVGLTLAILFHSFFNTSIIIWGQTGMMVAFGAVWAGVVWLLWTFERTKSIAPRA